MPLARISLLAGLAALVIGVLPAAAGSNDWGTWTITGSSKSWSGTVVDSHRITGVVMGLKSRVKWNRVTSFTLGGKTCKTSPQRGTGYCYFTNIPPNTKLTWSLTTKNRVRGQARLVPCIMYQGSFHCRYGNG